MLSNLEDNLGLETYYPRLRRQKVIRRVRRTVEQPLFPRYLFCRFNPAGHYRMVRHAQDVIDVVSFGGRPAIVDPTIIQDLRSLANPVMELDCAASALQVGDHVAIKDGPMQGLRAVVLQTDSERDRVALLLSCLAYQAQVLISSARLERIS